MQICDTGLPFSPSHLKERLCILKACLKKVFFWFSSESFELSRKFAELLKYSNRKNNKSAVSLRVFEKVQKVNQ